MLRVPELGCDENVLALEAGYLAAKRLLESTSDLFLVAVDLGKVNVAVTSLESLEYGRLDLAGLGLPCAKTQLAVSLLVACLRSSSGGLTGCGHRY